MANYRIQGENQRRGDLQDNRREEAVIRQTARDSRSNSEQIELLNQRLGDGTGATKERARLAE